MTRKLGVLGLVVAAVFAMGALMASAAAANSFHSNKEKTTLTGSATENHKFQYEKEGPTVECKKASFSGTTTTKTTTTVTITPVYSECSVPSVFNAPAHVTFNGCDYLFHIEAGSNTGPADLVCPEGASVTITVTIPLLADCTFHIGAQTPAGTTDYSNEGTTPTRSVIVQPTQTGIVASRTGNSSCGATSSTTGTYTGKATVKGDNTEKLTEQADLWVE